MVTLPQADMPSALSGGADVWDSPAGALLLADYFPQASGGTNYSLSCAIGSFSSAGVVASLERGLKLSAAQGTFTLTGAAATFPRGRSITAATGAFPTAGQPATFLRGRTLTAQGGAVSTTGVAAGMRSTRLLPLTPGAFVSARYPAGTFIGRRITGVGTVITSGKAAELRATRRLYLGTGPVAVAAPETTFSVWRNLSPNMTANEVSSAIVESLHTSTMTRAYRSAAQEQRHYTEVSPEALRSSAVAPKRGSSSASPTNLINSDTV